MRPHRNPINQGQFEENHAWRAQQFILPRERREEDWNYDSAWRIDDEEWMPGYGPDGFIDPFAPARFGVARREREPRQREDMDRNAGMLRKYPELNLDKLPDGPEITRDIKLPPFKIDYDTHEQIHQKLNGTIILIKNQPFTVMETAEIKKGEFALAVYGNEREPRVVYYKDIADCRGIAPGYFVYRGASYWTYRIPERQNSQGMHQRNMRMKAAGQQADTAARPEFLMSALGVVKDVIYSNNLQDMILGGANQSIRLTNRVSLYNTGKKGAPIGVEYCGRDLGLIVHDQCKVYDEADLGPSWLHKDMMQAGLNLTA